ncbi:hypothetical protein OFB65_25635, partial [Escherichia coli]|nr:hypothetical protein [Escherichia coli]
HVTVVPDGMHQNRGEHARYAMERRYPDIISIYRIFERFLLTTLFGQVFQKENIRNQLLQR